MKRFLQAYFRNYFRIMAFLMRAFVIAGLAMFTIVAMAQLLSGDPFTSDWGLTYAVALSLFGVMWLASKKVRQMGAKE